MEEPIDFWVNRPLAEVLVRALAPLPVTPNQVTILSGVVGIFAGAAIVWGSYGHLWLLPLGAALFYLSILLDCADGQLARLRGTTSMVGRMLDGVVDVVPTAAVFFGLCYFMIRSGYDFWIANAIGWSAGYCTKWHVHAYDHAKNVYLANVRPPEERAAALPTLEEIARERDEHRRRGDRFGALVLSGFLSFTRAQRQGWQEGRLGLGLEGTRTEADRRLYRERFHSTMRLWTWNGLGTHLTLLLLATLATPFYAGAGMVAWLVILVPMNALTLYLRARERRVEEQVQTALRPTAHA